MVWMMAKNTIQQRESQREKTILLFIRSKFHRKYGKIYSQIHMDMEIYECKCK